MDRRPVQKIEVKLTILMRADSPEAAQSDIEGLEIDEIAEMVTTEDAVAGLSVVSATTVRGKDVEGELVEIGNDGTFFDVDGDDDEPSDSEDGEDDDR